MANGGPRNPMGLGLSMYFVMIVVIGNYVLLNTFLAIVIDNLTNAGLMAADEADEEAERQKHLEEIREKFGNTGEGEWMLGRSIQVSASCFSYTPSIYVSFA